MWRAWFQGTGLFCMASDGGVRTGLLYFILYKEGVGFLVRVSDVVLGVVSACLISVFFWGMAVLPAHASAGARWVSLDAHDRFQASWQQDVSDHAQQLYR